MKCCKCGRTMEDGISLYAVDKAGTLNRRWQCTDCMDSKAKESIDPLCKLIDPNLNGA